MENVTTTPISILQATLAIRRRKIAAARRAVAQASPGRKRGEQAWLDLHLAIEASILREMGQ